MSNYFDESNLYDLFVETVAEMLEDYLGDGMDVTIEFTQEPEVEIQEERSIC